MDITQIINIFSGINAFRITKTTNLSIHFFQLDYETKINDFTYHANNIRDILHLHDRR